LEPQVAVAALTGAAASAMPTAGVATATTAASALVVQSLIIISSDVLVPRQRVRGSSR
jgi:hypothetical protein